MELQTAKGQMERGGGGLPQMQRCAQRPIPTCLQGQMELGQMELGQMELGQMELGQMELGMGSPPPVSQGPSH